MWSNYNNWLAWIVGPHASVRSCQPPAAAKGGHVQGPEWKKSNKQMYHRPAKKWDGPQPSAATKVWRRESRRGTKQVWLMPTYHSVSSSHLCRVCFICLRRIWYRRILAAWVSPGGRVTWERTHGSCLGTVGQVSKLRLPFRCSKYSVSIRIVCAWYSIIGR